MELKCVSSGGAPQGAATRFNRTFMELKFAYLLRSRNSLFGFNRTFMELKFGARIATYSPTISFNRTFMELKFVNDKGGVGKSTF